MYSVGLAQLLVFKKESVMNLTPMQLILSLGVVVAFLRPLNRGPILSLVLIYLLGFGVEVLGIQTGFPFGSYNYGPILGPKIAGTPLLIGINWLLVIIGSATFTRRLWPKASNISQIFISATIALGLDVLIEPVAVALDMWTWTEGEIPSSNYIAWWVLAAFFSAIYNYLGNKSTSWVVITVFLWMLIFFSSINFFYL
jgi:putative membrane protein